MLVHGRSQSRAEEAVESLQKMVPTSQFEPVFGDFSIQAEVRNLASQVKALSPTLDVLVNNAGVKAASLVVTIDGFESTWAINHLASFLLTNLLLGSLQEAEHGRVVTVSSVAHNRGKIDFDDLNGLANWESYRAYAQSKLANALFSNRLSVRLAGTNVTSNAVHPGAVTTKLLVEGFGVRGTSVIAGAEPSISLASDERWLGVTGRYFGPQGEEPVAQQTQDVAVAESLWTISEQQTGLSKEAAR